MPPARECRLCVAPANVAPPVVIPVPEEQVTVVVVVFVTRLGRGSSRETGGGGILVAHSHILEPNGRCIELTCPESMQTTSARSILEDVVPVIRFFVSRNGILMYPWVDSGAADDPAQFNFNSDRDPRVKTCCATAKNHEISSSAVGKENRGYAGIS